MENLAPPLELLMEVRFGLEKGQSMKSTLLTYIETDPGDPWRQQLSVWLKVQELGRPTDQLVLLLNPVRRQVLEVLEAGLRGEPVYPQICRLEEETFETAKIEIEEYIATLPIKSLVPLLFFQFPAFLALLLGPFLGSFLAQA